MVFLQTAGYVRLRFFGRLKKSYTFSRLLVCRNKAILWGHILNVCKTRLLKLTFHLLLSYELPEVFLQELYLHLKYVLNDCIYNNFDTLLSKLNENFF